MAGKRKIERSWIDIGINDDDFDNDILEYARSTIKKRASAPHALTDTIEAVKRMSRVSQTERKSIVSNPDGEAMVQGRAALRRGTLPIEWYTFRIDSLAVGFDLEMWWRLSGRFIRFNALIIVVLLFMVLLNAIAGLTFIGIHLTTEVDSPYTCTTKACQSASKYMIHPMNTSVNPCDNFYEFVCGNYEEEENEAEGRHFQNLIKNPGFKLESGEDSILSKILKDFRDDSTYDQSIRYYQSCLNEPAKRVHGIDSFLDRVSFIFGTRDFSTFESMTSPNLDEIAGRIFRVVGHAFYINLAFSSYPFIHLLTAAPVVYQASYTIKPDNRIYVESLFKYLMPHLGIQAGAPEITELVEGVGYWAELFRLIHEQTVSISFADTEVVATFQTTLSGKLPAGICPPMDLKVDYVTIFNDFLQETDWDVDYIDLQSKKYWLSLKWCFNQTAGSFAFSTYKLTSQHKRLSFVSIWLFGLFQNTVPVMHSGFLDEFLVTSRTRNIDSTLKDSITSITSTNVESKCMEELWRALGYLPSLRYLSANIDYPVGYLQQNIADIYHLYGETRERFWRIPRTEIHRFMERQGQLMLRRQLHVDILMPLIGETLDTFRELLAFNDDHLNNHFIALNLTIESGRLYWMGSTDPISTAKWWAYGDKIDMRDQLLELRFPFLEQARFLEKDGAFTKGRWRTFLGRRDLNYILFSLALLNEPHISETWVLKSAGSFQKIIRAFLSLVGAVVEKNYYPYYNDRPASQKLQWRQTMRGTSSDYDPAYPTNTATCDVIIINRDGVNPNHFFQYNMETLPIQSISSNDDQYLSYTFMNLMALKIAFDHYRKEKKELLSKKYTSDLSVSEKKMRLQRFLPGNMKKYSEDQLFFMAYVRHLCRSSWKKSRDFKHDRYILEVDVLNVLMQSNEFQKTWKCPPNSNMNNRGRPKCFKWVP